MADNAATPPGQTVLQVEVRVSTIPLYGIFVSEQSFLIGVRNVVKAHHVQVLAMKVLAHKLPQELVDVIAEFMLEAAKQDVQQQRRDEVSFDDNKKKFTSIRRRPHQQPSPAEAAAETDFAGVSALSLEPSKPPYRNQPTPEVRHYVHLSAVKRRPALSVSPPALKSTKIVACPCLPNTSSQAVNFAGSKGTTHAFCHPEVVRQGNMGELIHEVSRMTLVYRSDEKLGAAERASRDRYQATTLTQCVSVEEAIREWNAEAIEKFVDCLELEVVPFEENDPLRPGLHLRQRVADI